MISVHTYLEGQRLLVEVGYFHNGEIRLTSRTKTENRADRFVARYKGADNTGTKTALKDIRFLRKNSQIYVGKD